MADIKKLTVGQVLWVMRRHNMGKTTMKTTSLYTMRVTEICDGGKYVMASWNGNPARRCSEKDVRSWRVNKPMMRVGHMGQSRLMTRDEIKAALNGEGK
jgi:hypothetical protein